MKRKTEEEEVIGNGKDRLKRQREKEGKKRGKRGEKKYRNRGEINVNRKIQKTGRRERRCKYLSDYNAFVVTKIFE